MAEGVVKWFHSEEGRGVLTVLAYNPEDVKVEGDDVLVDASDIQMLGYRYLGEGGHVSFAIERDAQGEFHARKVTPLNDSLPAYLTTAPRPARTGLLLVVLPVVLVVLVVVALITLRGSSSTGRISADAVRDEVRDFAGADAKLYASQAQIEDADDGTWRSITVFTACKPAGGCEIVAPDGAGYPDFQHFVDDTELIDRGDEVLANADMTSPGASTRLATFKKSAVPAWARYAGGGALAIILLLTAIWLVRKTRRRAGGLD